MPDEIQSAVGDIADVRTIYLSPDVTDDYDIRTSAPDTTGIVTFLCGEREFSEERVKAALDRAFGSNNATEPTLF